MLKLIYLHPISSILIIFTFLASVSLYSAYQLDKVGKDCNPNYSGCVTKEMSGCSNAPSSVRVTGEDVYGLDRDGDGIGCEPTKWREKELEFSLMGLINLFLLGLSAYVAWKIVNLSSERFRRIQGVSNINNAMNKDATKSVGECPECRSPLVLRTGKYGQFTGCSSFPNCKYVKRKSKK